MGYLQLLAAIYFSIFAQRGGGSIRTFRNDGFLDRSLANAFGKKNKEIILMAKNCFHFLQNPFFSFQCYLFSAVHIVATFTTLNTLAS